MFFFLIDESCRPKFESLLPRLDPRVAAKLRWFEYSEFSSQVEFEAGTYVFTGVSLMKPERLRLVKELESRLDGNDAIRILNRPTKVISRLAALKTSGHYEFFAQSEFEGVGFPAILRYDDVAGTVESDPVQNRQAFDELVAVSVMAGYSLDRLWAVPLAEPRGVLGSRLALPEADNDYARSAGLDFARVEFFEKDLQSSSSRVWRVNDSPLALLPTPSESGAWLKALDTRRSFKSL